MSQYGVTPQGFVRKSFQAILDDLVSDIQDAIGPINQSPESAIWQQINSIASQIDQVWQATEGSYFATYPATAKDKSLDGAVQLIGLERLSATRTRVVVEFSGDQGTIIDEGFQASTDQNDVFELEDDVVLDSNGDGSGEMFSVETGRVPAPANSLTNIETPVAGLDSINNPDEGELGRETETDPELRERTQESTHIFGAGTPEAIRARLLQLVDDVSAAKVIENRTDSEDSEGRPPHSFETVVEGGLDQDVADEIWISKPAGIETAGSTLEFVEDSEGDLQPIRFSRPAPVYVWLKVTLDANGVGVFPDDAAELAEEELVSFGRDLGIGDKIVHKALYVPIFDNIDGLEDASIEIAVNDDPNSQPPSGDFTKDNIDIAQNALSLWDADRIDVTINE